MRTFERYILRRAFLFFAGSLFWTLAIVWTTQVLARVDLVTDGGQSALTFFKVASLILPSVVPIVVAFSMLIAASQVLTTMNTDSELAVINAAGSPRSAVVRPILLLAMAASVFAFVVDSTVDPYARQRGREIVAAARADLLSLVIQEGTFRKVEDHLYLQIARRLPDGKLGGIFIADARTPGVELIYYAREGIVSKQGGKSILLMENGELHRKSQDGEASIIRFSSNAFDLSSFTADSGEVKLLPKDRTLSYLFNPDPNDKIFQNAPQFYRAEIHRRLTEWIYPFVFATIALAVAANPRSHREARIHPLVTAALIALVVRWLGFFTADRAQSAPGVGVLVYLVPAGAMAVAALFLLLNKPMELPLRTVERGLDMLRRLRRRLWLLPGQQDRRGALGGGA